MPSSRRRRSAKGSPHREASVLLACPIEEKNQEIYKLAGTDQKKTSTATGSSCSRRSTCPTTASTGAPTARTTRRTNTSRGSSSLQEDIRREVIALQDMGHKRLALEAGEDPVRNTMDYYLKSIETIYSIKHKNGAIRRVSINIAATTVDNYRLLKEAGIGTYILFQETYHKESYLSSIRPARNTTTTTTPEAMSGHGRRHRRRGLRASSSALINTAMNSPACSCMRNIWRQLRRRFPHHQGAAAQTCG